MRVTFVKTLIELAEKDDKIYLLCADLGFGLFDEFIKKFPSRFINCGIAEQNMMGIAAGLALSGKKVYAYSIIPFVTFRCLEQIRNDICYQKLDVKIVGVGSGFTYGSLGFSHQALEDVAVLRALIDMTVLCPADPTETRELILQAYQAGTPTYIRLPKSGERKLYDSSSNIEIGKPSVLRVGEKGVIIATGILVETCLSVVEILKKQGYDFGLISLHTLKPIDTETLLSQIGEKKVVFTIEEHNVIGGLGSAVAETLAESSWQGYFKIIALPENRKQEVGNAEYLRQKAGLEPDKIADLILESFKKFKE